MAFRTLAKGLLALLAFATLASSLAACSSLGSVHDFFLGGPTGGARVQRLAGFIGGVAADEPRAALAARDELAIGGNAADAATALGFTLAVTLPSRAGLGAGGACLVYNPAARVIDGPRRPAAVMFTPVPPARVAAGSDRPAAVPMLARGLFLLHARYGSKPFETLIAPAEQLSRFGGTVSRALATDLKQVAAPLLADPNARAVFGGPGGGVLAEGAPLVQPDLGGTLAQLRVSGVGDLYQGVLAHRLADASALAGGALSASDLRDALPREATPLSVAAGSDIVAFSPPPADGGLGAAAAFTALEANPGDGAGRRRGHSAQSPHGAAAA